jgi:transcriptional regulator with PAS, ATPase and Fis domain
MFNEVELAKEIERFYPSKYIITSNQSDESRKEIFEKIKESINDWIIVDTSNGKIINANSDEGQSYMNSSEEIFKDFVLKEKFNLHIRNINYYENEIISKKSVYHSISFYGIILQEREGKIIKNKTIGGSIFGYDEKYLNIPNSEIKNEKERVLSIGVLVEDN